MSSISKGARGNKRRLQIRNRRNAPVIMGSDNTMLLATAVEQENGETVYRTVSESGSRRQRGSAVLQELNNGSVGRANRDAASSRPRLSSAGFTKPEAEPAPETHTGDYNTALRDEMTSPPLPRQTLQARSFKLRGKVGATRRSLSGETRQYIDRLETELVAAQSELAAINSPSATRLQTLKMKTLHAENVHLQEQLNEWEREEKRFEERLQEITEHHTLVETGLREKLEQTQFESEEAQYRVRELDDQLQTVTQNLDAAETANVQLEKRVDMMSELLAMSPTKIDLHAESPTRRQRLARPISLSEATISAESIAHAIANHDLPPSSIQKSRPVRRMRRFIAGSLGPKPLILPSTSHCELLPASAPAIEREDTPEYFTFEHEAATEDEGSPPPASRRRASTMTDHLTPSKLLKSPSFLTIPGNGVSVGESAFSRPTSAASQFTLRNYGSYGSSAGRLVSRNLLEELTLAQALKDGDSDEVFKEGESEGLMCSVMETATVQEIFENEGQDEDSGEEMEGSDKDSSMVLINGVIPDEEISTLVLSRPESSVALTRPNSSATLSTTLTAVHGRSCGSSVVVMGPNPPTEATTLPPSVWARLRALFGKLWRSPMDFARHLIHAAQSHMHIPRSISTAQWWLVGLLLGPMARRRMMSSKRHRTAASISPSQKLLLPSIDTSSSPPTTTKGEVDTVQAYGKLFTFPCAETEPAPSPELEQILRQRRKAGTGMAGFGKKRAAPASSHSHSSSISSSSSKCSSREADHQQGGTVAKHSPWMWLGFSITVAYAIGSAFTSGPGALMKGSHCQCAECKKERTRQTVEV